MADAKKLKERRDDSLDNLLEVFDDYMDKELKRKEAVADLIEKILEAHNTPTSVSNTVIDTISVLAERDLDNFLSG